MSLLAKAGRLRDLGHASGLHAGAGKRRRKAFGVLVDEAPIERAVVAEPAEQAVPQLGIGAGLDGEMQIGALAGGGAARIDVDDAHAALGAGHLDALVEDRVAPGRVGADEDHEIGKLQVVVALRHDVGAERPAVAGDGGGHAQARVGIDVRRADEALGQLVGDVVVLGQQLSREIEGDRGGAMRIGDARDAGGDMIDRLVPSDPPPADLRMEQPGRRGPTYRRAPSLSSTACRSWRGGPDRRQSPRHPCRRASPARRSPRRNRGRWCAPSSCARGGINRRPPGSGRRPSSSATKAWDWPALMPPCSAAMAATADSTSLAMRLASPHT